MLVGQGALLNPVPASTQVVKVCEVLVSRAAVQPSPATMQLVVLVGSQLREHMVTPGITMLLPSRSWIRHLPPSPLQSLLVSQKFEQEPWVAPRQMFPGEQSSPGPQAWLRGSVPAVTQTRVPVLSTVHMSVVEQPHCGESSLQGLSSHGVPLLDDELVVVVAVVVLVVGEADPEDCDDPEVGPDLVVSPPPELPPMPLSRLPPVAQAGARSATRAPAETSSNDRFAV